MATSSSTPRRKKGSASPQAAARDAFRDSLRKAAERVFIAKGFGSLKMTDIAAEAGVGVGTIYNYFADKQAVFEAVFEAHTQEFDALLERAVAGKSALAQLEALVHGSLEYLEENGALVALFEERGGVGELDIERLAGKRMAQGYERYLRLLETAVAAAVDAGELRSDIPVSALVAALSGARNGAIYAWLKGRRRQRLQTLADHILELFLSGARAR